MTKDEMRQGFAQGRTLIQEEWSRREEIIAVDELIIEGACEVVDDWRYLDGFQCERRKVRGVQKSDGGHDA